MDEAPSKPVWTNSETGKGASDTLPSTLSIHSRESDPSSTPRARTCTTGRPGSRSSSPIPPIRFRCSSTRCHHSGTREYGWPTCCACTPPPTCSIRSWSGATTARTGTAATSANPSFRLAARARSTRCGSTWRPTRPSSTTTSSGSTTRDEPGAMAHSFPARTGPSAWRRFGSTGSARSIQAAPREAYPEAYSPSRFRGSTAISF